MRLVTLAGIGALACAAVALACTDQPSAPQARAGIAEGSVLRIHGAGTFTIHTTKGPEVHALPAWSASGRIKNGIAHEDGAGASLGVIGIANSAFAPAATEGKYRTASFTDPAGARHDVVWINSPDGSPPHKVAHYLNGHVVQVTEYEWTASAGGWLVASVTHRAYRDGKPTAEGRVSAGGVADVASRGESAVVRMLALLAASWIAPADANAQFLSGKCRMEWLAYLAAQASLSAATIALETNPEIPALYLAWVAAAAAATITEMKLWLCLENQNPPIGRPGGGPASGPLPVDCNSNPDPVICAQPPDQL